MADSGKAPKKKKREGRFQAAPPAWLSVGEPFEGFTILEEWRSPESVVLWQALRASVLWARTPAPRRPELFSRKALERRASQLSSTDLQPDLLSPLRVASEVLSPDSDVTVDNVAWALRTIAEWAEAHDRPRTAISFAQGAALVLPRNPAFAYTVGLYCRRNAEYDRAETWFRRARVLSWRASDRQSYALSWVGLGNVYLQRGRYEEAKEAHLRALRVARRGGFWHVKAMALHDLFTIAVDLGQVAEAERLAHRAVRAYSVGSPQMIYLANDIATFWMNQGFYQRAVVVFQAVLKLLTRTDARLISLSGLARAAAGVGNVKLFTDCWVAVHLSVNDSPTNCHAGVALLMLAYGAATLKDWTRTELAARHALELSTTRGESEVSARARVLLDAGRRQRYEPELIASPDDPTVVEAADDLARLLVRRLDAGARREAMASLREALIRILRARSQ